LVDIHLALVFPSISHDPAVHRMNTRDVFSSPSLAKLWVRRKLGSPLAQYLKEASAGLP